MNLIDSVKEIHQNPRIEKDPPYNTGDTVAVHTRIKEGEKSRIQIFQGVIIAIKRGQDLEGHFRVRKISFGFGVERVFPLHSPNIKKIEVIQYGKTRQSKLYYLRDRKGKAARIAIDYDRK